MHIQNCGFQFLSPSAFRPVQGFAAGLITPLLTKLLVQTEGQENMGKLMAILELPQMQQADLDSAYHSGFLVATILTVTMEIPALLLTTFCF